MNKSNSHKPKLIIISLILLIFTTGLTGCDPAELAGFYNINVEIEGLDETASDNLKLAYNDEETVDQLEYDNGLFKATISNLRGEKTITPILSSQEFYTTESYSDKITVNSDYNGRTIKFYANETRTVENKIQEEIDKSNPGDTLEIISPEISENLNINKTGLNIIGQIIQDNKRSINSANITISGDDISFENFKFTNGAQLSLNESNKTQIKNNDFENNADLAVLINNS